MSISHHTPDETEDPHARKYLWILLLIPLLVFGYWIVEVLIKGV